MAVEPYGDDVDLYNLPPVLRRKLFSNVERFRLEQKRLAQAHNLESRHYQAATEATQPASLSSKSTTCPPKHAHPKSRHELTNAKDRSRSKKLRRKQLAAWKSPSRLQKHPVPSQAVIPFLVTQADSEWFRSLPPKVQRRHFSSEEQAYLRSSWRSSVILDAADKALYRLGHQQHQRRNSVSSIASAPTLTSAASTMASSPRVAEPAVDIRSSIYDSFRWLDEDDELDLSLDNYHHHIIADSTTAKQHARKPSFRRTFSFAAAQRNNSARPASALPTTHCPSPVTQSFSRPFSRSKGRTPSLIRRHDRSTQSFSNPPIFSNNTNTNTNTTSGSKHMPQSSITSIDQPAQYYQDPEARLKLRVYLASPQKFDEAIEFGFPALETTNGSETQNRTSTERKSQPRESGGEPRTSFLDENTSYLDDVSPTTTEKPTLLSGGGMSSLTSSALPSPTFYTGPRRQSESAAVAYQQSRAPRNAPRRLSQNLTGGREMTLKMTLTRADLRTADSLSSPGLSGPGDDPLKLADLPTPDQSKPIWDAPDEENMVKKMWRRLRGR